MVIYSRFITTTTFFFFSKINKITQVFVLFWIKICLELEKDSHLMIFAFLVRWFFFYVNIHPQMQIRKEEKMYYWFLQQVDIGEYWGAISLWSKTGGWINIEMDPLLLQLKFGLIRGKFYIYIEVIFYSHMLTNQSINCN